MAPLITPRKERMDLNVNDDNFGIEMPDGSFRHIYADELVSILGGN